MKIASPVAQRKTRIEVIPLIDIMFFLLAAFVLVSLSMVRQLTVEVDLPQSQEDAAKSDREPISLAMDREGQIYYGFDPVELDELRERLETVLADDRSQSVLISGDAEVSHGAMVGLLQIVRACGAENAGFAVSPPDQDPS